jgi:hypothetical protein
MSSLITLRDGARELTLSGIRPFPIPSDGWWEFARLLGWGGLTDDKSEQTERPQAHGSFSNTDAYRTARAISFNARFVSGARLDAEIAIDDLSSFGAQGPILMIRTTEAGRSARSVDVQSIQPLDARSSEIVTLAVNLIAPDPRRYALDVDIPWAQTGPPTAGEGVVWPLKWPLKWPGGGSSGRVTVTNMGKAPSAPQFRLHGGFSSALITCLETGARIGLDRLVPSGSTVAIDTAEHRAQIDGQSDVSRWLQWREWELVPPGESRTYQFDVTGPVGSPILEGRVLSAWW